MPCIRLVFSKRIAVSILLTSWDPEIMTGQRPYADLTSPKAVLLALDQEQSPAYRFSQFGTDTYIIWETFEETLAHDPSRRPSIKAIRSKLSEAVVSLLATGQDLGGDVAENHRPSLLSKMTTLSEYNPQEYKSLSDTARNLPLLRDEEELAHIYNNRATMQRLRELAGKETGEVTTFNEALCHLELIAKPPEPNTASEAERLKQLVISERAAEGHIRDAEDPVSFLPTSVAAVTFVATQSLALGARMWSLRRHQKYLLDSLQKSHNPHVTVGLVAWMLLSNRDYIGNTSQRSKIFVEMGIIHEFRPNHTKEDLEDIGAALRAFEALGP